VNKGDRVKVVPLDGPMPAGIPYSGFVTTVRSVVDNMVSVNATNGVVHAVLFKQELRSLEEGGECECGGTIVVKSEPCYCSATSMPPCSNCESSRLECDECGEEID
jgi:hypothetical protein